VRACACVWLCVVVCAVVAVHQKGAAVRPARGGTHNATLCLHASTQPRCHPTPRTEGMLSPTARPWQKKTWIRLLRLTPTTFISTRATCGGQGERVFKPRTVGEQVGGICSGPRDRVRAPRATGDTRLRPSTASKRLATQALQTSQPQALRHTMHRREHAGSARPTLRAILMTALWAGVRSFRQQAGPRLRLFALALACARSGGGGRECEWGCAGDREGWVCNGPRGAGTGAACAATGRPPPADAPPAPARVSARARPAARGRPPRRRRVAFPTRAALPLAVALYFFLALACARAGPGGGERG
jgi:hypothetical protein